MIPRQLGQWPKHECKCQGHCGIHLMWRAPGLACISVHVLISMIYSTGLIHIIPGPNWPLRNSGTGERIIFQVGLLSLMYLAFLGNTEYTWAITGTQLTATFLQLIKFTGTMMGMIVHLVTCMLQPLLTIIAQPRFMLR